jgi:hypothetical protein
MLRVRLASLAAVLVVVSLVVSGGGPVGAAQLAASGSHGGTMKPARTVRVRDLPQVAHASRPTSRQSLPLRVRDQSAFNAAKANPLSSRAAVRAAASSANPRLSSVTTSFTMENQDAEASTFGVAFEPPDTQLAAGPGHVAEMVNDVLLIDNKTGGQVGAAVDLNVFFGVPAGFVFTDPRIIYDAESGRWFASGFSFNASSASHLYVAMSNNSDPTQGWLITTVDNQTQFVCDQPKLGVNTDKVTLSCAYFNASNQFVLERTWAFNKAQMIAGGSFGFWFWNDSSLFSVVPAISLSPNPTAYLVENDATTPIFCSVGSIVVLAISGVPTGQAPAPGNRANTCLAIPNTSVPPSAQQPAGGAATVVTNDDRFLSATIRNGVLWASGNTGCTPTGDTVVRSCMRLEKVTTTSAHMGISSVDLGANGLYDYFPAVTTDRNSDLFIAYSQSSSTVFPSAVVTSIPAATTVPDSTLTFQAGTAAYGQTRWGDYSAAAPDPDPASDSVWVGAEYAGFADHSWGTAAAKVTEAAPTAASISPTGGSAAGGDSFTINGTLFAPGATVSFGGHLATNVVVGGGGTTISGRTPTGTGTAAVTVTNPDSRAASVASGFAYSGVGPSSTTFFFSEGNTISGFDETLLLFMPNASGTATVTYFNDTGPAVVKTHAVTAGQVLPVNVQSDDGAGHIGVSASVQLPSAGVVERALNFMLGNWHGSESLVGATAASSEWDFAEGSTLSAYSEFLTLQNPASAPANTTINYFTDQGVHVTKTLTLPAASRTTVVVATGDQTNAACAISSGVAQNCGVGPGIGGVSAQIVVTSGPAIIAERPFYVNGFDFGFGTIRDGHDDFGTNAPAATWNFAEGTTFAGFTEFLTLQNPGATSSNVTLNYVTDTGQTIVRTVTLPATSRTTVPVFGGSTSPGPSACSVSSGVAQNCGVGPNVGAVSAQVTVTSGPNIVAERPMYISVNFGTGTVAGATVAVGATSLGTLFGFSSAQTVAGENDFLTILNSNAQSATVTITYYDAAGGFPQTETVVVPPQTRQTVQMFAPPGLGVGGIGPGFSNLGIVVSSDTPILVEEPTYSSNSATYGARDTLGFTPSPAF